LRQVTYCTTQTALHHLEYPKQGFQEPEEILCLKKTTS